MRTVRTVADLRAQVAEWRKAGQKVGLVPTMGALHDGHLSLVRQAKETCQRVVATIFVNPKQFGPKEDFAVYPRDEEGDAAKLEEAGTDLLFAPAVSEMYPEGSVTMVSVPGLGDILEGEYRPGFFTGVATVVAKLLLQAQADLAVFGEKDYQQLQVIRRLVADLDIPVQVLGAPTRREADGLAMSSRNAYLTAEERAIAPSLNAIMRQFLERARAGERIADLEQWAARELKKKGFRKVDYVTLRDAETLLPVEGHGHAGRLLAAAWLGRTRLIDNMAVEG